METKRRPMTARERRELGALVSPVTSAARAVLFLVVLGAVGWVLRSVQIAATEVGFPVWAVVTAALGSALYRRAGRWTGGRELRGRIRDDLSGGEMSVHVIRVAEAVVAPEIEDEGPVVFIRDEDGTVLFFAGQEVGRRRGRGFPWSAFEVSHAPKSQQLIGTRSLGGRFEPVRERAPLGWAEAKELGVVEAEYGVLEMEWADVRGRDAE